MYEMSSGARLGPATGPPALLEPIPLRHAPGPVLLPLSGAVLLGLAGLRANAGDLGMLTTILPVGLGLVCLVTGAALLVLRSRSRGALTLHEKGFVLERAGRQTALRFDEVDSLALRQKRWSSSGTPVGIHRRATVRSSAGTLRFAQFSPSRTSDHVAPVLQLLLDRLAEAAEARLRAGGSLDGEGWSLGPGGFSIKAGTIPVPVSSL